MLTILRQIVTRAASFTLIAAGVACAAAPHGTRAAPPSTNGAASEPASRKAYFGDLHLHSSFSIDAYMGRGNVVTPQQAFQFARGMPIGVYGQTLQRDWALDFLAITDHAENIGIGSTIEHPDSPLARSEVGRRLKPLIGLTAGWPLIYQTYEMEIDMPASTAAWSESVAAANRNNVPGVFTAFIGFEWIGGDAKNMRMADHRSVIFDGADAPYPLNALRSEKSEDLWAYMEDARARGMDSLAIVNHPTSSHGAAFAEDRAPAALDKEYARRRSRNEPLVEIVNTTQDHETTLEASPAEAELDLRGPPRRGLSGGIRSGLASGLALGDRLGINPFQLGVVGSSDHHTGLSFSGPSSTTISTTGPVSSAPTAAKRPELFDDLPGPLTGVWAEENTRSSIFAALRRREVFATSGPRIKVRFFGGWNYEHAPASDPNWIRAAYSDGTPMGGTLTPRPSRKHRPRFLICAEASPEGIPLARAQVVKITLVDGQAHEKIIDVEPTPTSQGEAGGATTLSAIWEDREFEAAIPAVYYLRVFEAPTERWRLLYSNKHASYFSSLSEGKDPGASKWSRAVQQRAWSSPIWYSGDVSERDLKANALARMSRLREGISITQRAPRFLPQLPY